MNRVAAERRRDIFDFITVKLVTNNVVTAEEVAGEKGLSIPRARDILAEYMNNPRVKRELSRRLNTQDFTLHRRGSKLFLVGGSTGKERCDDMNTSYGKWLPLGRRKILSIGNSLAITLPKHLVKKCEEVEVYVSASEDSLLINLDGRPRFNRQKDMIEPIRTKPSNDEQKYNRIEHGGSENENVANRLLSYLRNISKKRVRKES